MTRRLISIVIPAFNEQDNIDELARQLTDVFEAEPAYDFEVLCVENGSEDATYERLAAVHSRDPRFKIIQLARNFRMDGGVTAGLAHATGDAAVVMTADLQDPPPVISDFLRRWEEGYENVYGIVSARHGTGPVRRMNSQLFYWLAARLTDDRIPRNVSDFRLVDRKVYETVNRMQERNRFVRGLFAWVGYRSIGVEHERVPRHAGTSNAHTLKVLDLAMKGILAHSYRPLKLITALGVALAAISMLALVVLTADFVLSGVPFPGFGTLLCVNVLMFGFLFVIVGIVSEYVGLIYEEVKQRPNFVVRDTVGLDDPRPPAVEASTAEGREG